MAETWQSITFCVTRRSERQAYLPPPAMYSEKSHWRNGGNVLNGTLNGVPLRKVSALRTNYVGGFKHTTFRVLDCRVIELEEILRLDAPALFLVNLQHVEGRIVHYTADLNNGYEI